MFRLLVLAVLVLAAICFVSAELNFLVLGDWGKPIPFADAMAKQSVKNNITFILGIGDNFYQTGVKDLSDSQWNKTFEAIYTHPIYHQRWYLVAGNHDWMGNVTAQLEYTRKSQRWYFPSLYYSVTIPIGPGEGTAQFIYIDTCQLVDKKDEAQWAWLEQTLAASTADWIFVIGHYPAYSVGHYGVNPLLSTRLVPILEKYKVAAYIAGHDHGHQYMQSNTSQLSFIVTGNVAKYSLMGKKVKTARFPKIEFFYPNSMSRWPNAF